MPRQIDQSLRSLPRRICTSFHNGPSSCCSAAVLQPSVVGTLDASRRPTCALLDEVEVLMMVHFNSGTSNASNSVALRALRKVAYELDTRALDCTNIGDVREDPDAWRVLLKLLRSITGQRFPTRVHTWVVDVHGGDTRVLNTWLSQRATSVPRRRRGRRRGRGHAHVRFS